MNSKVILAGGNVIDVASGDTTIADVVVNGGRVSRVEKGDGVGDDRCDGYARLDVSGKWILPGLIDMHVHIKEGFAPQFVASGVTTVRNTGGNVYELRRLRQAASDAPTPRVISADRLIDGPPGCWGETSPWNLNTSDPKEARQEVKRQVKAGADFIKVYGLLKRDVMVAVVDEAEKHNRQVSCDLLQSSDVTALEAAQMGVKWNEHASGFIQDMYPGWSLGASDDSWRQINWEKPDESMVRELCEKILEYGVILCPTMDIFDQIMRLPDYWDPKNVVSERTRVNTGLTGQWETISSYGEALKVQGRMRAHNQLIAKTYFDVGGTIVAGTDVPAGIWTFPGMALHREMELFVEAGFSQLETLRAATITAARALDRDDLGHIRAGAVADMLVLNSNPLENIKNTQDIYCIVKGGRVYTQEEILSHIPSNERIDEMGEEFMKEISSLM